MPILVSNHSLMNILSVKVLQVEDKDFLIARINIDCLTE
jgi:hypothetical protein